MQEELVTVLTMMMENIEEKELSKIAEKFVQEIDRSHVSLTFLNSLQVVGQDTLISFEEFVQIMETCDVERKMSLRFVS